MAVTLYRQVGKGKARRYQKVNLGRGRRPADLTGPYFLRYSLADGDGFILRPCSLGFAPASVLADTETGASQERVQR
jgi:hypothetical protein